MARPDQHLVGGHPSGPLLRSSASPMALRFITFAYRGATRSSRPRASTAHLRSSPEVRSPNTGIRAHKHGSLLPRKYVAMPAVDLDLHTPSLLLHRLALKGSRMPSAGIVVVRGSLLTVEQFRKRSMPLRRAATPAASSSGSSTRHDPRSITGRYSVSSEKLGVGSNPEQFPNPANGLQPAPYQPHPKLIYI